MTTGKVNSTQKKKINSNPAQDHQHSLTKSDVKDGENSKEIEYGSEEQAHTEYGEELESE